MIHSESPIAFTFFEQQVTGVAHLPADQAWEMFVRVSEEAADLEEYVEAFRGDTAVYGDHLWEVEQRAWRAHLIGERLVGIMIARIEAYVADQAEQCPLDRP